MKYGLSFSEINFSQEGLGQLVHLEFSSSVASKKKRTVSAMRVQASNIAAKEIFLKQDDNEIQKLKAELATLRKELEEKKTKVVTDHVIDTLYALYMCFHKAKASQEISDDDYDDDHCNDDRYNDVDGEDNLISLSDYDMPLSEYELATKRRQENHQLAMSLGIAKVTLTVHVHI